jgi:hypothetical protein
MLDLLALLAGAAAVPRDPDFLGPAPLPAPTDAPPGSRRKVRVLTERFRLRQELWHPDDARADPRLGFLPAKNPGPHGERFKAALLVELAAGVAEC